MKLFFLVLLFAAVSGAQEAPSAAAGDDEQQQLGRALAEAGASPIEFVRALEKHLEKFPNSARRAELERALVKAAMETRDDRRIVLYGEKVLARESDDLQILERVTRALLVGEGKDTSERALKYARRYEEAVIQMRSQPAPSRGGGQWQEDVDRALGRALVFQARANGSLGRMEEAIALARRSYEAFPSAESAREIGRWLSRSGREAEAVRYLADAFTIADPRNTDTDRARDRARMGELYRKANGSEKGLGDVVLEAYDRTSALVAERRLKLRESDPNTDLSKPMEFTLSSIAGDKLKLGDLRGKVIVFDFWATWCGPCRAQHPLYEQVKLRFKNSQDVVFLSVNTDEDRELVAPFLKEHGWKVKPYFEDGLSRALQISSIPTTIIVDRRGEIFSRMNGYLPDRFVDMLTDRIRDALKGA
jgi:thiol-disulfide isomerase/thioredoxin